MLSVITLNESAHILRFDMHRIEIKKIFLMVDYVVVVIK
jgi:hypothetical protein